MAQNEKQQYADIGGLRAFWYGVKFYIDSIWRIVEGAVNELADDLQNHEKAAALTINEIDGRLREIEDKTSLPKIVKLTESEYNSLKEKDENTLYFIMEG